MSKRKRESISSIDVRKRLRRSCEKVKEDKAKELKVKYSSLFCNIVSGYCVFMFNLLVEIDEDATNLSFQRKYDEIMFELYSFCERWKHLIELESIYFHLEEQPGLKTGIVHFNYNNPKEFVDRTSMHRLNDEINSLDYKDEHVTLDDGKYLNLRLINGVCQPKIACKSLGLNEDFTYALETNIIGDRLNALIQNKTDSEQVKTIPTVRYSKKDNDDNCSVCLGDFRVNEELFKLQCGHLYHKKCLKDWLKKSNCCPLCKRILS